MRSSKLNVSSSLYHVRLIPVLCLSVLIGACSGEKTPVPHEEIIAGDFEAILDINDHACGGVSIIEKVRPFEYRVTCVSGEAYRINVGHEGHVNVAPHKP
jgi:hypothetical protein